MYIFVHVEMNEIKMIFHFNHSLFIIELFFCVLSRFSHKCTKKRNHFNPINRIHVIVVFDMHALPK